MMNCLDYTEKQLVLITTCQNLLQQAMRGMGDIRKIGPDKLEFIAEYSLADDPKRPCKVAGYNVSFVPGLNEGDIFLISKQRGLTCEEIYVDALAAAVECVR